MTVPFSYVKGSGATPDDSNIMPNRCLPNGTQQVALAVADDQQGANPRLVTETDPLPASMMILDHETGKMTKVQGHHGMAHTMEYLTGVGLGIIAGHEIFRGFGQRSALTTGLTGNDVSENALPSQPVPDQSTGEQMTIVSTDANDTIAGTNVQKIEINYLDLNGISRVETVEMDGLTPVNTVATDIRFVQRIHTIQIGSFGQTSAGDITIYQTGDAARVYNVIKAGGNISLNSTRMIPADKEFALTYVVVSGASNKPLSIRLRATCTDEAVLTPGIFLFNEVFFVQDAGIPLIVPCPRRFPALTVVKGTAYSAQGGGDASISWGGWIE